MVFDFFLLKKSLLIGGRYYETSVVAYIPLIPKN